MADQDESVDSRTSIVGRKRPLEGSVESGEFSGDGTSADEASSSFRKRARQDDEHDGEATSPGNGVVLDMTSTEDLGMQTEAPSTQSLPQQLTPEVRSMSWNKGVQSAGIRTSFGAKKQRTFGIQPSRVNEEVVQPMAETATVRSAIASFQSQLDKQDAEKGSATVLSESEELKPFVAKTSLTGNQELSPRVRATDLPQTDASVEGDTNSATQAREISEDVEMIGASADGVKSDNQSKLPKIFDFNTSPLSRPTSSKERNTNFQSATDNRSEPPVFEFQASAGETYLKPLPPVLRNASNFYEGYAEPNIAPTGPKAIQQPAENAGKAVQSIPVHIGPKHQPLTGPQQQTQPKLTKSQRRAAAATARGSPPTKQQKLGAIQAVAAAQGMSSADAKRLAIASDEGSKFTKNQIKAYRRLSKQQKATLSAEQITIFENGILDWEQRRKGRVEKKASISVPTLAKHSGVAALGVPFQSNATEPIAVDDSESENESKAEDSDSYDPEDSMGDRMDFDPNASAPSTQRSSINTPAALSIEDILANLNETELELQLKYFPTDDGRVYIPHCLFCTQVGHATIDCPAISCTSCGEASDHSTSSCPKRQRCGKCRELGHPTIRCPAKLARLRSEAVPCDLCGSLTHIESQCHMIWRSFFPKPEEIQTVRSLPMSCYTCGRDGHLGPDCGLYKGPGNMTWSHANFMRYVSSSSNNQVISAPVDYTIKSQAKKSFSIKGKANNPITLDESDDDTQGFIHTKVNTTAPKGNIQFGNIQPPSGPRRNAERELRASFGNDSYAPVQPARNQGSARYERERTFSPPPRFGENRSQYPPPQYPPFGGGQQPSGPFQDFSRAPPQPPHRANNPRSQGTTRSGLQWRPPRPGPAGGPGKNGGRKKPKAKKGQ